MGLRTRLLLGVLIGFLTFQVTLYMTSQQTYKEKNYTRNNETSLNQNLSQKTYRGSQTTTTDETTVDENTSLNTNLSVNLNLQSSQTVDESDMDTDSLVVVDNWDLAATGIPAVSEEVPFYSLKDYFNESNKMRPVLEIVRFGRLGNWLFHYAVCFCTALQTHRTPTVAKKSHLFTLFPNLSAKKMNVTYFPKLNMDLLDKKLMVGEPGWSKYRMDIHERVRKSNNTWLKGCFQTWRYLVGCEKALRREFTFDPALQEKANIQMRRFAEDYMENRDILFFDITFIGIHVRLGDMFDPENIITGYKNAPPSYIEHAMDYYNKKYKWPLFITTSENIDWCMEYIESQYNNVYFSNYTSKDYMLDFIMLSSCNHSILTVGSYGWFTGWMANGEVVYYDQFPEPESGLLQGVNFTDRYPAGWIGMS